MVDAAREREERARAYAGMPAENRLRRECAGGDVSRLPELVELSARRGRHWDVLAAALRVAWRGKLRAVPWASALRAARSLARQARARRAARGRPLRLAFFHGFAHFRDVARSVFEAAARHERLQTGKAEEVVAFRPDVVLSPQANPYDVLKLKRALPEAYFVYLRHGPATKANAYAVASYYDAVCVSSPFFAREYVRLGALARRTVWITGDPQADLVAAARGRAPPQPALLLYAPTHNPGLTSAGWLEPQRLVGFVEARPALRLAVKLHANLSGSSEWAKWRAACAGRQRVEFCDDPMTSLAARLPEASLVISDFSSAALLFLPFDRPIVLLTPPAARASTNYDPEGVEMLSRDMAEEVTDLDALEAALGAALADPRARGERRRHWCRLVYGDTLDGRSGERVVARIERLFG